MPNIHEMEQPESKDSTIDIECPKCGHKFNHPEFADHLHDDKPVGALLAQLANEPAGSMSQSDFDATEKALMDEIIKLSIADAKADDDTRKLVESTQEEFESLAAQIAEIQTNYLIATTEDKPKRPVTPNFVDDLLVSIEDFLGDCDSDLDD